MKKAILPELFLSRLKQINPSIVLESFSEKPFQSFRINTLKISISEAKERLAALNIPYEESGICDYAILVASDKAKELLASDMVVQGQVYAQGLQSMLPVLALDPKPKQRVLDLCAAPGSKTTQVAQHMQNNGILMANDPIKERFYRLKAVTQLLGAKVELNSLDGRKYLLKDKPFDRILVDAPCSSEGRFCVERPKTLGFWSLRKIKEMSHKQKGLLLNASRLLAPDGLMVYSTCTFAPEENEEVVDWLLRKAEGLSLEPIAIQGVERYSVLQEWLGRTYLKDLSNALRVLPSERMEGFFIAKFKKSHYK